MMAVSEAGSREVEVVVSIREDVLALMVRMAVFARAAPSFVAGTGARIAGAMIEVDVVEDILVIVHLAGMTLTGRDSLHRLGEAVEEVSIIVAG
jgi:hypothetical protein